MGPGGTSRVLVTRNGDDQSMHCILLQHCVSPVASLWVSLRIPLPGGSLWREVVPGDSEESSIECTLLYHSGSPVVSLGSPPRLLPLGPPYGVRYWWYLGEAVKIILLSPQTLYHASIGYDTFVCCHCRFYSHLCITNWMWMLRPGNRCWYIRHPQHLVACWGEVFLAEGRLQTHPGTLVFCVWNNQNTFI